MIGTLLICCLPVGTPAVFGLPAAGASPAPLPSSDPVRFPGDVAPDSQDDEDELDALLSDLIDESGGGSDEDDGLDDVLVLPAAPTSFQSMNPNISVIGDFIGHASSREDPGLDDGFQFRELELSFSAAVDPFARADAFISIAEDEFGDWAIAVEEAYVTFLDVPHDLQPRIGHFRSTFGKANGLHLHALPFVEYPLVLQNTFSIDGAYATGVGVNWLVPTPGIGSWS